MTVLDASAAVEWLLGLPLAEEVAARIADPDRPLHAPHLLAVETTQVFRRFVATGAMAAARAARAVRDLWRRTSKDFAG